MVPIQVPSMGQIDLAQGQRRPWSNGNEEVLITPQIFRTGVLLSDVV